MRLLWLTPDKPEDISVGRRRIADHIKAAGHEVTLRGTTPRTALSALREARSHDVVVGTTRAGAFAGAVAATATGTPFVVDHVDPIRQFEETAASPIATAVRQLENIAFRFADHVLYVYPEEESRVARYATVHTKTDLGVEYDRFADPDPAVVERAGERLESLPLRENVVTYVGGLEPIYHVKELVDSISHLDEWSLVVAGAGSLTDYVCEAARLQDGVEFLGTVPHEDVPGYLHHADVGVSLVDDPYTLKVLEYGSAGIPVVQVAGRAENRFGEMVVYTDLDPRNVADAIRRADRRDGTELQSFVGRFDWANIAKTYLRIATTVE